MNNLANKSFQGIKVDRYDLAGARAWMSKICGPHALDTRSPHSIRFRHSGNIFQSMATTVGKIEYGTDVMISVEDTNHLNSYSISLPLMGEQELNKGGELIVSNPARGLIVSPHEVQTLVIAGNCQKVQIAITCSAMRQMLESLLQRSVEEPIHFTPGIDAVQGATGSWWRLVQYYLDEIETDNSLFGELLFARDIESSLIKGLILSQDNNYSEELRSLFTTNLPHYLIRAKAFIDTNVREELCVEDIEIASGVSRLKLFEAFRRHYGISPMAYLKKIRLEGVRQEMLEDHSERNVSAIAMGWGFKHLGRFAIEYKKLFLEAPSVTLQKCEGRRASKCG